MFGGFMTLTEIQERIVHVLGIYPIVSPSMLSIGLGTALKTTEWRSALENLVEHGIVKRDFEVHLSPKGQDRTYTKIYLAKSYIRMGK